MSAQGASSGIGYEFCIDLAKSGCKIIAAARRTDRLKTLCDEINGGNDDVRAVAVELDVSADGATIEASVKKCWEAFGRIDALINNAGIRGASSGIGYEFCIDLAKSGCKIIAAARRTDRLKTLCDEINGGNDDVRAVAVELDVSADGATIEASVKKCWEAFGRIDALINNAGIRGASSGIGYEFCIDLAKSGCKIIAAARRTDRLKTLCDEINGGNDDVRAVAVELDVSADGATIEASVKKCCEAFGRIDALINNAGIRGPVKNPLNLSEEDWDRAFNTNLRGSWLVSKYVGLHMVASNQGGSIINISSTAGLNRGHLPGALAYATSKSALNTMTKVMAMELGGHKIRVNSISPGIFKSEITEELLQKKWFKNVVSKTMPLKELGVTDPALTSLVKYLIHGSSNYVTAVSNDAL
ncbi:hypothetical protein CTI12_AA248460 [Artemisia annua]|uniref:Glucose/ribitol dehydrogenase n=1 Tax=Artemisia annua TaxID=35608 RepID=A0A2U1NKS4_ARTAN|nr:hypothetical protein CTI12_AA248460 [Artemisia annua]